MSQSEKRNNNTRIIVIIVIVAVLLLCCCGAVSMAGIVKYVMNSDIDIEDTHGGGGGRFEARREITERFAVSAPPRVVIENGVGSITVVGTDGDEIVVHAVARAWGATHALAEAAAERIEVSVVMEGDDVLHIFAAIPEEKARFKSPQVEIEVEVPYACEIDVTNKVGEIRVLEIAGSCSVALDVGSIEVSYLEIEGDNHIRTRVGSVDVILMEDCACYLDAEAGIGAIDCEANIGDMHSRRRGPGDLLQGVIGDDPDATLTLRTSTGSILILHDD